jgi:hypothetical protein
MSVDDSEPTKFQKVIGVIRTVVIVLFICSMVSIALYGISTFDNGGGVYIIIGVAGMLLEVLRSGCAASSENNKSPWEVWRD